MKVLFKAFLFVGLVFLQITVCVAEEFQIGEVSLSSCTRIENRENTSFLGNITEAPEIVQAPQKAKISTFIDGDGISLPNNQTIISGCVQTTASEIGLSIIASDTAGASFLFKEKLIACLQSTPDIHISSAFLKSENKCLW